MTVIRNDAQAVHTHPPTVKKNSKHKNYRTTSKLPALGLKLERVLHIKMKGFIQRNLCKNQHGYKKTSFDCDKSPIVMRCCIQKIRTRRFTTQLVFRYCKNCRL